MITTVQRHDAHHAYIFIYSRTGAIIHATVPLPTRNMSTPASSTEHKLLVQIASYNTALQGFRGVPQDLVDWLAPTLKVSNFLSRSPRAPDIVAVGFQELLPLHQGRMYRTNFLLYDSPVSAGND